MEKQTEEVLIFGGGALVLYMLLKKRPAPPVVQQGGGTSGAGAFPGLPPVDLGRVIAGSEQYVSDGLDTFYGWLGLDNPLSGSGDAGLGPVAGQAPPGWIQDSRGTWYPPGTVLPPNAGLPSGTLSAPVGSSSTPKPAAYSAPTGTYHGTPPPASGGTYRPATGGTPAPTGYTAPPPARLPVAAPYRPPIMGDPSTSPLGRPVSGLTGIL